MLGIPLFRFISRSVRQISETNRKSSIIPLSCSQNELCTHVPNLSIWNVNPLPLHSAASTRRDSSADQPVALPARLQPLVLTLPRQCSQASSTLLRISNKNQEVIGSSRQAINSQVRYLRQASSSWHLWRQASSASHLRRQGSSSSPSTASGLWAGQLLPSPSKYLHNNNKKWDNYICIHGTSTLLQKILPLRLQVQDSDQSIRRTFEMLQHRLNHVFSVLRGSF